MFTRAGAISRSQAVYGRPYRGARYNVHVHFFLLNIANFEKKYNVHSQSNGVVKSEACGT